MFFHNECLSCSSLCTIQDSIIELKKFKIISKSFFHLFSYKTKVDVDDRSDSCVFINDTGISAWISFMMQMSLKDKNWVIDRVLWEIRDRRSIN